MSHDSSLAEQKGTHMCAAVAAAVSERIVAVAAAAVVVPLTWGTNVQIQRMNQHLLVC